MLESRNFMPFFHISDIEVAKIKPHEILSRQIKQQ